MSNCIDRSDQTTLNALASVAGPGTNSNGEYTLNQIDVFAQDFLNNIENDAESNPIINAKIKYGDSVDEAISYLNGNFFNQDYVQNDLPDYPNLNTRLQSGSITAMEFTDFIEQFNHTPSGVITKGNEDYLKLLYQLERYYAEDIFGGALAGICGSFQNIFGAIEDFFNLLGQIEGLVNDAFAFLSKIRDFKKFIFEQAEKITVEKLIKAIKKFIGDEIEKIITIFQQIFENFKILDIIDDVTTYIDKVTIKRIMKTKDDGCLFFSDKNKQTIRDKINNLFDYAFGLFENPTLEVISFLGFRICALMTNIKGLMNDFKSPLDQFEFKYKRISNRLKTISNVRTSSAIQKGAIRFSPESRAIAINSIQAAWDGENGSLYTPTGKAPINPKPPTIEEYEQIPACSAVKAGTAQIRVEGSWVSEDVFGMEGWTGLDYDLRVYLNRLQQSLDAPITVTEGWRSQQYNAKIGGSPENAHISGKCVDIKRSSISAEEITSKALLAGFKYVVVYDDYIHLDIRKMVG